MNSFTGSTAESKTRQAAAVPVAALEMRLELTKIAMDVALEPHLADVPRYDFYSGVTEAPGTGQGNEILARAALEIEVHGWHQGDYEDSEGCVCALEAVNLVAVNGPARSAAVRLLMDRIEAEHGRRYPSIHAWNDSPTTTREAVLSFLRH